MARTYFDRQEAASLYRFWYIEKRKPINSYFDVEQIESMHKYVLKSLKPYIDFLLKAVTPHAFRIEIPMIYFKEGKLETFKNEALVVGNSIQATNMAGCMAVGNDLAEAYFNYLYALIECTDVRHRNNIHLMHSVHTMRYIDPNSRSLLRTEIISELKNAGWDHEVNCFKNSILWKPGSQVTYTIPQTEFIDEGMIFWFRKMKLQISAKMERDLYSPIPSEYWSCDICDGNQDSGCLFYDPTECPRV